MTVQRDRVELMSNDFMDELTLDSVESNVTVSYTPQYNGLAETINRIIVNDANTMIKLVNCPKSFEV